MSRHAIETVKKLLRMARRAPTEHERSLAQSAADEMCKRHKIDSLQLVDDYKRRVTGVAGVFWREILLIAIAPFYSCTMRHAKNGDAVIIGDDVSRVDNAFAMYKKLELELLTKCATGWYARLQFLQADRNDAIYQAQSIRGDYEARLRDAMAMFPESLGGWRPNVDHVPVPPPLSAGEIEKSRRIWYRIYLDAGAEGFADALRRLIAKPVTEKPSATWQRRQDTERNEVVGAMADLIRQSGKDSATQLADAARSYAQTAGNALLNQLTATGRKRIAIASSFLPPLPLPVAPPISASINAFDVAMRNRMRMRFRDDYDDVQDDGQPDSVRVSSAVRAAPAPTPPPEPPKPLEPEKTRFELLEID